MDTHFDILFDESLTPHSEATLYLPVILISFIGDLDPALCPSYAEGKQVSIRMTLWQTDGDRSQGIDSIQTASSLRDA
jgi:hypothetical protein